MIRPLGDRLVVRQHKGDTMHGGLYLPDEAIEDHQHGEVVAVGDAVPIEAGIGVGTTVVWARYAGELVDVDGEEALLISAYDLVGVLE